MAKAAVKDNRKTRRAAARAATDPPPEATQATTPEPPELPPPPTEAAFVEKFRNRIKGYKVVPAANVQPNPRNWRTHPENQSTAMRAILDRIGFVSGAITRELGGDRYELIDGHLRRELVGDDGLVPILITDLTEDEADEVLATFDHLTTLAVTDTEKLSGLFSDLKGLDVPLHELGWAAERIEQTINPAASPPPTSPGLPGDVQDDPEPGAGGGSSGAGSGSSGTAAGGNVKYACPKCGHTWEAAAAKAATPKTPRAAGRSRTVSTAPPPPAPKPAVDGTGMAEKFRNRIVEYVKVPAGSIRIHPRNWRVHPEFQSEAVRSVLERIGFTAALIVFKQADGTYMLIDGHLRRDLADDTIVPVLVTDLTPQEADEVLATYDNVGSMAGLDKDRFGALMADLKERDAPLSAMGWPDFKLNQIIDPSWTPPASGPVEFPVADENIATQHECPACGYRWSGRTS